MDSYDTRVTTRPGLRPVYVYLNPNMSNMLNGLSMVSGGDQYTARTPSTLYFAMNLLAQLPVIHLGLAKQGWLRSSVRLLCQIQTDRPRPVRQFPPSHLVRVPQQPPPLPLGGVTRTGL